MIQRITQKQYKQIQWKRKHGTLPTRGGKLYFKGVDNLYYCCDTPGFAGVKEIKLWQKKLTDQLNGQTDLFTQET